MIGDFYSHEQYGWICPKCGRVMAPWMTSCTGCDGSSPDTIVSKHACTANDYLKQNKINHEPYCEEFKSF